VCVAYWICYLRRDVYVIQFEGQKYKIFFYINVLVFQLYLREKRVEFYKRFYERIYLRFNYQANWQIRRNGRPPIRSWLKRPTFKILFSDGKTYCIKSHLRPKNKSDFIARNIWKLENRKESKWTKKSDYDSISRKRTCTRESRGVRCICMYVLCVCLCVQIRFHHAESLWLRRDNEIIQMRLIRQRILWTYPVCAVRSDAADVDTVH